MKRIGVPVLAAAGLLAAGCGGSSSSSSGTAAGEVNTSQTSTIAAASFDVNLRKVQAQLSSGLKSVEKGDLIGAGTVLVDCTNTVTSDLGSRAKTAEQQQSVSQLRTACTDAANALAKLKAGDKAAAKQLAQTAANEVAAAK